jgi:hypothetical protein
VVITEGIDPMGIAEGPYSGRPNPHAWMSPTNALVYIENIRKALAKHDPANAEVYARNAAAYSDQARALDEPLRKRLAAIPDNQRWLVSSEGAFSYLARDYAMREAYLWPINADEQGTPQQVRKVIDLVRKNKIPVVFSESTISDRAAKKDVAPVDAAALLDKLAHVPVFQWHYQWEETAATRHLGPMAQDFKAAFYPGRDDKSITTLEFDGVALAAIQGLNQKVEEQASQLKAKEAQLQEQQKQINALLSRLGALEEKLASITTK